jgi:hypothetical protein
MGGVWCIPCVQSSEDRGVSTPLPSKLLSTITNILSHTMPNHVIIDFLKISMFHAGNITFEEIFKPISQLNKLDRIYTADLSFPVWLHEFSIEDQYIIGDLVRLRMQNLPNKGNLKGIIEDLGLADNEGIAEHTAFFYHKATQVLLLQKVQGGVDIGRFCNYFEQLSKEGFKDLQIIDVPILEEKVIEQLKKGGVKSIKVGIAIPSNPTFLKEDHHSIEQFLRRGSELNAGIVEFKFSAERKKDKNLYYSDVCSMVNTIFRLGDSNPGSVKKLKSNIVLDGESKSILLDLLNAKMKAVITTDFNSRSRVIPYAMRIDALKKAWTQRKVELAKMFLDA